MKPRIDVGGRQGRDERDGITTRNGGGSYEHGMPITFEGDEPPDYWQWITDMKDAAIDIAKLAAAVAIVAALAGLAYKFLTN